MLKSKNNTAYTIIACSVAVMLITGYIIFVTPFVSTRMTLTSSAFAYGESIPAAYTCDGSNTSPPLSIANIPEGTQSLVLIMDDPDVPVELVPDGIFDHWILFAIPPDITEISEGSIAGDTGLNGAGKDSYIGPCPPPEYEPTEHRYFFRLFALNVTPAFDESPTREDILPALNEANIVGTAELMGTYDRAQLPQHGGTQ